MRYPQSLLERHDLTEAEWARVAPHLPSPRSGPHGGRPARDRRTILNGILWILATGASWRDLPERYGAWQTCYHYFRQWARDGTWRRLHQALQRTLWRDFKLDVDVLCIDNTVVRARRAAAGGKHGPGGRAGRSRPRVFTWRLRV